MSLIKDIQRDLESTAFQVVLEYRSRLYADAVRLCGDSTEAEDLVMRTFDCAFRDAENFDAHKGEFYSWIKGILAHLYSRTKLRAVNRGTVPVDSKVMESYTDADWRTDEQLLKDSDSEALKAAMDRMDPEYKKVLVMHYFGELPVKNIALALNLPMGTVLWRLSIARKMLAKDLAEKIGKKPLTVLVVLFLFAGAVFGAWQAGMGEWLFGTDEPTTTEQISVQKENPEMKTTTKRTLAAVASAAVTTFSAMLGETVNAAEYTWTGAAGNNNWMDGQNWSGTVPGDTDTVIFPIAATVTPPATFAGLVRVNGSGCLTVNVPSEMRFSLAMGTMGFADTGALFRKTGAGLLTLQAHGGINPGTVTIAEGAVAFAGNGDLAAGAFDRVVLESGVMATVVESPIATRHGYAYRIGKGVADIPYSDFYNKRSVVQLVRDYEEWSLVADTATRFSGIQTVAKDALAFDQGAVPRAVFQNAELKNKAGIMFYYRGLFISEGAGAWKITQTQGNGAAIALAMNDKVHYREWVKPGDGTRSFSVSTAVPHGWATMTYGSANDLRYWDTYQDGYWFNLRHALAYADDTGFLTGAKLWNGVAFTGIEVKDGASLTVADGQALAIANARAFKVDGSFAGSASAYLYLASDWSETDGDAKLSAAALRGFAGVVDLAPTAKLGGETATSPVPYTLTGEGELTVTAANRDQVATYAGALSVAADLTLDPSVGSASAELTEKAVTWQLGGNAVSVNDGTAVRVLDKTSTVSVKERTSIIATEGIPAYCPFEFSCDVYMPNWWGFVNDYWDLNYGLFVQAEGPVLTYNNSMWSSRVGYMLPANKLAFGVYETGYSGQSVSWVTNTLANVNDPNNNTKLYVGNNSGANTWRYSENKPMRWTLSYDGFGSFTASIQTNATTGGSLVTYFTYPQLTQKKYSGTILYPSFLGRAATTIWGKSTYSSVLVSNLTVKVLSTPQTETRRIMVEPGATLNVKVGQVDAVAGTPAVAFADLTLADGATLAYAPYWTGLVSGLDLTGVTFTGSATIAPAANENLTTTIGDFTSRTGGTLTVAGAAVVKMPLTVTVSREELKAAKGSVPVVTFLETAPALDVANVSVIDLDASGKTIDVSYADGKLKLNACFGLILVFR